MSDLPVTTLYIILSTGYEIHGTENIPQGPGLIVYYHGAIPIDYSFFLANRILLHGQRCYSVVDHFLFMAPGEILLLKDHRLSKILCLFLKRLSIFFKKNDPQKGKSNQRRN